MKNFNKTLIEKIYLDLLKDPEQTFKLQDTSEDSDQVYANIEELVADREKYYTLTDHLTEIEGIQHKAGFIDGFKYATQLIMGVFEHEHNTY